MLKHVQLRPGTYALLLSLATDAIIRIGRLGDLRLQPGFYVYVGSALGPGGVKARLAHHLRPAERPHWHIDYLGKKLKLEGIWFCYGRKRREHSWARHFSSMPGALVPMTGFGSSDCACESHLFFFKKCPAFRRRRSSKNRRLELIHSFLRREEAKIAQGGSREAGGTLGSFCRARP